MIEERGAQLSEALNVPLDTDRSFFSLELPRRLVQRYHVHLMIYEPEDEVIVRWQK